MLNCTVILQNGIKNLMCIIHTYIQFFHTLHTSTYTYCHIILYVIAKWGNSTKIIIFLFLIEKNNPFFIISYMLFNENSRKYDMTFYSKKNKIRNIHPNKAKADVQ